MSKILILIVLSLCIVSLCAKAKKSNKLKAKSLDIPANCKLYFVRNRQYPDLYLAPTADVYNTNGFLVGTKKEAFPWCFTDDNYILTLNTYALDIAESDMTRGEVIVWPQHAEGTETTQNQKWTHTQYWDNQNSFKIQAQVIGSSLPYLTLDPNSGDVVLQPFNMKNPLQDWFLDEKA